MKFKYGLVLGIIVLLLTAGGFAYFWSMGNRSALHLPGIVEIQEVRLGSKVGGRVESVLVKEGDIVDSYDRKLLVIFEAPELKNQKKQMLAKLEAAEAEYQRAQNGPREEDKEAAKAAALAAKARYARIKSGWRVEEKQQTQSELESAQASYELALREFNRVEPLHLQGAAARSEYDAAVGARDRSKGQVDALKAKVAMMKFGSRVEDIAEAEADWKRTQAQYELLRNGTRPEDIAVARAKVEEVRANIEAIDIQLAEAAISVPPNLGKAVVEVVAVRPGDLVPANQPVVRVLRADDLWVKIFVPETQYGHVTLHKEVDVTVDSHPGLKLKGVVVQRANIAEFTPRNVQSVDERQHQVFGVKILVRDPQGILNAGMAAEVTIPLE
jgi:HlyD family secretion protein